MRLLDIQHHQQIDLRQWKFVYIFIDSVWGCGSRSCGPVRMLWNVRRFMFLYGPQYTEFNIFGLVLHSLVFMRCSDRFERAYTRNVKMLFCV